MTEFREQRKYIQMENVINKINQKYISLPEEEVSRNRQILEQVLQQIISKMKMHDALFKNMFERTFYGGSFYDKLKVGKPEEYDLDCVLNLPLTIRPQVEVSDQHGFVFVRIKNYDTINRVEANRYKALETLMDENKYLCIKNVLKWMEKVITVAMKEFKDENGHYKFDICLNNNNNIRIYASINKAFPAFTLNLENNEESISIDIDLVTCFQFSEKQWPGPPYKPNCVSSRNKFLVVPKKPHRLNKCEHPERYWRLSFQEQERELIRGSENKALKPCLKLIKQLRDQYNHKRIASYFIKTIFLWEIEKHPTDDFWNQSLSYVFIKMLQAYLEMIENKNIPYYWNPEFNLIGHLKNKTCCDIAKNLRHLIDDLHENLHDPFVVAKYLVQPSDVNILRKEVDLGKKIPKRLKRYKEINQLLLAQIGI